MAKAAYHRLVSRVIPIKEAEVAPVLYSFFALFSILASYFLLLPLREDAGISLGTSILPRLMACSLVVTLLVTPAATQFLNRPGASRERSLKTFFSAMAAVLLAFYFLYNVSSVELLVGRMGLRQQQHGSSLPPAMLQQQAAGQLLAPPAGGVEHAPHVAGSSRRRKSSSASSQGSEEGATVTLRRLQQLREAGGSADVSSSRTTGQQAAAEGGINHNSSSSSSSRSASSSSRSANSSSSSRVSRRHGDPGLSTQQRLLRAAFYVWVNVMNLITISSVWARCAEAFGAEAGARLFGFIAAGATLGQLAGSLFALLLAGATQLLAARAAAAVGGAAGAAGGSGSSSSGERPASSLILLAALLQLLAAQLVCRVRQPGGGACGGGGGGSSTAPAANGAAAAAKAQQGRSSIGSGGVALTRTSSGGVGLLGARLAPAPAAAGSATANGSANNGSIGGGGGALAARRPHGGQLASMLSGFRLICSSEYLLMLCANLMLTYVVGALMYFQRALVVSAALQGTSHRTAFFARLNTYSAAGVLLLQLFATSSLLRWLGMSAALALGPAICLASVLAVWCRPSPAVVAVFEIIRKIAGYAINRPAREVLFTVVSREEKYSAKLVIDTVVQRLGDAIAAAAFEILDVRLRLGQAGVAAAGAVMCVVWLAITHQLGKQHKQRVRVWRDARGA